MTLDETHTFFALPIELHTYIFTLACTPSSTRVCTIGPSYYTAFLTGLALSLVSRYVYAASAPARHRAVVIYGWQELLVFERVLLAESCASTSRSRVRYLTLIADELPHDPSLLSEVDKIEQEKSFLDVIARILRVLGKDLYELDLGFQAIDNIKDPLAYLSLSGPGSPLSFPSLKSMFYTCPPSNALPWATAGTFESFPVDILQTSPHILCPCLEDVTVVCNDSTKAGGLQFTNTENDHESGSHVSIIQVNQFPCIEKLTILASTPEQALTALDANEAAWDVGSTLALDVGGLGHKVHIDPQSPKDEDQGTGSWPPQTLQTVILRPKSRWNERWASLRDVVRRQREATRVRNDVAPEALLDIFVLKPGEQVE